MGVESSSGDVATSAILTAGAPTLVAHPQIKQKAEFESRVSAPNRIIQRQRVVQSDNALAFY